MKKFNLTALSILITLPAIASIFNGDDRKDVYEYPKDSYKELSRSIPALVQKSKLIRNGDKYDINAKSLKDQYNFCADTPFSSEPQVANCSASLIGDDLILTAAHCLDKSPTSPYHKSKYVIAFDYKKDKNAKEIKSLKASDVYEIENMPLHIFDWGTMHDIAILKLKRKVVGRKPLKMNLDYEYKVGSELFMIGYPFGISQKLTDEGQIASVNMEKNTFRHHLDTFSVNSGSAMFDMTTQEIIGVLVRGSGANYAKYGRECEEWHKDTVEKGFAEGNIISTLKSKIKWIIAK
jgi:V8-like Glu-specific endopeptidase